MLCCFCANACINQESYIDIGHNNITEGAFLRMASVSLFELSNYRAGTGFLLSFSNHCNKRFTGWFINASGDFKIKKIPFEACVFYRINPFSEIMKEINWGILLGYGGDHFRLKLGNNFRLYKLNKSTIKEHGLSKDARTRIFEPRNLMYSFAYYIMPADHKWNASASIVNFDSFLIQQETNPMITGRFLYNVNSRLHVYWEIWYQSAGMFNLQANYFGFYFRTGLSWQIK